MCFDERDHVARPADADRGGADQVLEDQVPADDPGDELPHRRVRIGVRAAGDGDHRRHLGVAKPGEPRSDARNDERQRDGRSGVRRCGAAGENEDAGADDGPDSEHDQVERRQRALQPVPVLGVGPELVNGLGGEERVSHLVLLGTYAGPGASSDVPPTCSRAAARSKVTAV